MQIHETILLLFFYLMSDQAKQTMSHSVLVHTRQKKRHFSSLWEPCCAWRNTGAKVAEPQRVLCGVQNEIVFRHVATVGVPRTRQPASSANRPSSLCSYWWLSLQRPKRRPGTAGQPSAPYIGSSGHTHSSLYQITTRRSGRVEQWLYVQPHRKCMPRSEAFVSVAACKVVTGMLGIDERCARAGPQQSALERDSRRIAMHCQ